jgi:hypothetical protein
MFVIDIHFPADIKSLSILKIEMKKRNDKDIFIPPLL